MNLEISVTELQKKKKNGDDFILLDVRTDREHHFAQIPDSLHIPLDKLGEGSGNLEKNAEIIIYCHHGARSLRAAHILLELGFEKVKSLEGGIHEWSCSIDSSIPTY